MTFQHIPYKAGSKISKPGMYVGVPIEAYHGKDLVDGVAISSSGLRTIFGKSLAHYWCTSPLNPARIDKEEKEAYSVGRAAHHLLLGQKEFAKEFVIRPDMWDSWRTIAARDWRSKQQAFGKTVLDPKHIEIIRGIRDALAREPMIASGLLNGHVERSLAWKDKETDVWLLSRPDAIPTDSGDFVDFKTVADIGDYGVARAIAEFGWHQQGALVREACQRVLGITFTSFVLVLAEKKPPYCVRIENVDPDDLDIGHEANHTALKLFRKALDSKTWPGPQNKVGQGGYFKFSLDTRDRFKRQVEKLKMDLAIT